jgi:hypothetical protein
MQPTQPLQTFYGNELEREAVHAFMVEQLREMAADMALEGKDVSGIKDANQLVTRCFDRLAEMYGKIDIPREQNSR